MPTCTRKGCGKEFDDDSNSDGGCFFHPGGPVFHEGLKSWSCCNTTNKPVLDFEEFMKITGCTRGRHTSEKPAQAPKQPPAADASSAPTPAPSASTSKPPPAPPTSSPKRPEPKPAIVEPDPEDDLSAPVPAGSKCLRNGCKTVYDSDEKHRVGDGPDTVCIYHPSAPLFHEGSKGYLCCKPKVLEFDEFLKIPGCKTGRHLFVKKQDPSITEELIDCRIDHYQTPTCVNVSIFAKQVDKIRSTVVIEQTQIHLDFYLPQSRRFKRTLELYGPVDPQTSVFKMMGTKVELTLQKEDRRSWNLLERSEREIPGYNLTFGVGGRTGTIGAKDLVLDEGNRSR